MVKWPVKLLLPILLLAGLVICSLIPLRQIESPFLCLHLRDTGSDERLAALVKTFASQRRMSVSDLSQEIKPAKGESNLFIELSGDGIELTVAHLMQAPWGCFYGDRSDPRAKEVVSAFTAMLDKERISYETEHRHRIKEKENLLEMIAHEYMGWGK